MDSATISQTLMVASVFTLAGAVKGISGMGLPTVAMSLLGLWMPATQAAALLIAPSLATNLAQCHGPHGRSLARRLWPLWLSLVAMTLWAPGLGSGSESTARRLLGVALVSYGVWGLWRPTLPQLPTGQRWMGAVAGLLTGAVTAATAVFVLPMVPYLQALRLDKGEMIQAMGLSFGVATLALAVRLGLGSDASAGSAWLTPLSAWALGAAFAGLWLGTRLRATLSGTAFQRSLFLIFIGLGAANLLKAG